MFTEKQLLDRFMESLEQFRIDEQNRHEQLEEELRQLRILLEQESNNRDEYDKKEATEYEEVCPLQLESEGLFTSKRDKLIEELADNQLVPLLRERGIMVSGTTQRRSGNRNGVSYEFDIIAINSDSIVIVDVKTTLIPADVEYFIGRLRNACVWLPEYADRRVFGAIAYLSCDSNADWIAEKTGLFSIQIIDSSAKIRNPMDFKPKNYQKMNV